MDVKEEEHSDSSVSFDYEGMRLLLETRNDDTSAFAQMILIEHGEECSPIWKLIVNKDDAPRVGKHTLDVPCLIQYLLDGKDGVDGCSLNLKKSEDGLVVWLTISEERTKRRPSFEYSFELTRCEEEDHLSLLKRVYYHLQKENSDLRKSQSLTGWSLSMSSQHGILINTKEALLNNDLTQAAGTIADSNQWIEFAFPTSVQINGVVLGICLRYGAWSAGHLNDSKFQFSQDRKNWTTLFTVSGLNNASLKGQVQLFYCHAVAPYYRLYREEQINIGVGMVKFI